MNISEKDTNEILDFIDEMGNLVDHVKRMESSSGFLENFQKALAISEKTDIHKVKKILLSNK